MIRNRFIGLRLTEEETVAVHEMAKIKDCGVSELIREALDFYLRSE